jgi:hypothetical protein
MVGLLKIKEFVELSHSVEANSCSASEEIPNIVQNLKIHYRNSWLGEQLLVFPEWICSMEFVNCRGLACGMLLSLVIV